MQNTKKSSFGWTALVWSTCVTAVVFPARSENLEDLATRHPLAQEMAFDRARTPQETPFRVADDPNDPGTTYSWNGTACVDANGQEGYTQFPSNIPYVAKYRTQRFYTDHYGECYNLQSMGLSNLDMRDGNYQGAWFVLANLQQSHLDGSILNGAIFKFAKLDQVSGIRARLVGANFFQASAFGTQFYQADFSNANFDQAVLRGGFFAAAKFTKANFNKADASSSNFSKATLENASFQDALFKNASFAGADLSGMDLQNADMSYTNLRYADMTGAVSVNANLNGAVFDRCTILPDDIDPGMPQNDRGQSRGMRYVDDVPAKQPCPR